MSRYDALMARSPALMALHGLTAGLLALLFFELTTKPYTVTPTRTPRLRRALVLAVTLAGVAVGVMTPWPGSMVGAALFSALVTVYWTDGGWFDIPDRLTLSLALFGILWALSYGPTPGGAWNTQVLAPSEAIQGLVAGAGYGFLLMWIGEVAFQKPALGFGDVTLLAAIGTLRGPRNTLAVIPVAATIGLLGIGAYKLFNRTSTPDATPLGIAKHGGEQTTMPAAPSSDSVTAATAITPADVALPDDIPPGASPFGIALMLAALLIQWIPWQSLIGLPG